MLKEIKKNLLLCFLLLTPFVATAGQKLDAERNYFIPARGGIEITRTQEGANDFKVTLRDVPTVRALSEQATRDLSREDFVKKTWTAGGSDSFKRKNPNVIISLTNAKGKPDYHFMEVRNPVLTADGIIFEGTYLAKVGDGVDFPAEFQDRKTLSYVSTDGAGMMVDFGNGGIVPNV